MYDPELTNYLTMIVTTFITIFVATCYMYGVCSDKVEPLKFSDKFDIGYIDDNEPVVAASQPDPPRAKTESKKKKKKKLKTIEDLNKRLNDIEKRNRRLEADLKKKSRPSSKPAPKPAPKPEIDEQLMRDCSDALIGFGEGKRKAKQASAEILENHPEIKTVEEFIKRVFKR